MEDAKSTRKPSMSRSQLYKLFKRNHGSLTRVADRVGVRVESVSRWLQDETNSPRIEKEVLEEAERLLDAEAKNKALRERVARHTALSPVRV